MDSQLWQKIKLIFDDALKLAPDERVHFIHKTCGNKKMRHEVEILLKSHDKSNGFMEHLAVREVAEIIFDNQKHFQPGQIINHFKIIKSIGSGGMGRVYLARDIKLKRKVALKLLSSNYPHKNELLKRFEQEAYTASALNHPNILTVYEILEEGSFHCLATEYIEGITLRRKMLKSRISLEEILKITIQIAVALTAAHSAGVIHRDIKPENIMIRPDGLVKVLDFGLAKTIRSRDVSLVHELKGTNKPRLITNPNVVMGTVSYLSPEQAKGEKADERSDVFSLGVMLYEMVTGEVPFIGKTISESLHTLLEKEPEPLNRSSDNYSKELQNIIEKALCKNRDERYQTMCDMLSDLERLTQNDSEESSGPNYSGEQLTRSALKAEFIFGEIKKYKSVVVISMLSLLTMLGYFFLFTSTNKPINSIAVIPFVNDSNNQELDYLTEGMTETLINSLSQLPNLKVKGQSTVLPYKGKELNAQLIGKELGVQSVLYGHFVRHGDLLTLYLELIDTKTGNRLWGEQYNKPMNNILSLQNEIADNVSQKLGTKLPGTEQQILSKSSTENSEAYQLYLKGRYFWNRLNPEDLQKSIDYYNQAIVLDPNFALAYAGLADVYNSSLNFYPPLEVMPKAKEAAQKAISLDDNLSEAHTAYGTVLMYYDYDFTGAERELKRSIEINPNNARARQNYSALLLSQTKLDEAIKEYHRALEMEPLSLPINWSFGLCLYNARRYEEAGAQMQKTLELEPKLLRTHLALALIYQSQGKFAEAAESYARGQEIAGHPEYANSIRQVFVKNGLPGVLRFITDENTRICSPYACTPYTLATFYAQLGEKDKAFIELERAYENRNYQMAFLRTDPRLDPLRDDPRFEELLVRMNLKD